MIVDLLKIAKKAQAGNYAVPAFNVSNLEMAQAVIRAGLKKKSPLILQTSAGAIEYAGGTTIYAMLATLACTLGRSLPLAIHLDHGKDLSLVKYCLELGYNSVHMDASAQPYGRNVRLTKQAVQLAKKYHARVQGELGAIMGSEGVVKLKKGYDYRQDMTQPEQAGDFVRQTGIDTLAVSVGTIHGSFKGTEKIDVPRIKKIAAEVSLPLVLHGGSGNRPAAIKSAVQAGICLINVDTDLRLALVSGLQRALKEASTTKVDPRQIFTTAYLPMQAQAEKVMDIFGSSKRV